MGGPSARPGGGDTRTRISKAQRGIVEFLTTYSTGAILIFLHRDSESLTLDERLGEFEPVERQDVVPVVPVRMSEAWLLFDSSAIARAAGSRTPQVAVPPVGQLENIVNPKELLDDLLFRAAGAPTGRRGRNFRRSIARRRVSVADHIEDYGPLENLAAFRRFQDSLAQRYPYRNVIAP